MIINESGSALLLYLQEMDVDWMRDDVKMKALTTDVVRISWKTLYIVSRLLMFRRNGTIVAVKQVCA